MDNDVCQDLKRAFVSGASWWQFYEYGSTMWNSDQRLAEDEAEKRYGSQRWPVFSEVAVDTAEAFESFKCLRGIGTVITILNLIARHGFEGQVDG